MPTTTKLTGLHLILTAQCNLRCRYCFQEAKQGRSMSRSTIRSAIDLLLRSGATEAELSFTGGEPLLAFAALREAVEYAERTAPADRTLRYRIFTNGTLLDDDILEFLVDHDFQVQLSFDGVPASQAERAAGTHSLLDTLLDRIRERHPDFHRERLRVAMTVVPSTISSLPQSVRYFLQKDVREIAIAAGCSPEYDWPPSRIDELDEVMGEVAELAHVHLERTGEQPVLMLRRGAPGQSQGSGAVPMCGAARAVEPVVDVDGSVFGCTVMAASYRKPWPDFLAGRMAPLTIGSVDAPDLPRRLEDYRDTVARTDIFTEKERKYSSYGSCATCEAFAECTVCPPTIGSGAGPLDPHRVPDFVCAFHLVAARHRRSFPSTYIADLTRQWRKMLDSLGPAVS